MDVERRRARDAVVAELRTASCDCYSKAHDLSSRAKDLDAHALEQPHAERAAMFREEATMLIYQGDDYATAARALDPEGR